MNWLWPKAPRKDSNIVIRAGRLTHWLFVAAAVYAMIFGWVAMYTEAGENASIYSAVVTGLIMAVPLLLIGRGLRYLLAGE